MTLLPLPAAAGDIFCKKTPGKSKKHFKNENKCAIIFVYADVMTKKGGQSQL